MIKNKIYTILFVYLFGFLAVFAQENSSPNSLLKEKMWHEYENRKKVIRETIYLAKGDVQIQDSSYDFPQNPIGFNKEKALVVLNASQDIGDTLCEKSNFVIKLLHDAQLKEYKDIAVSWKRNLVQFLENPDDSLRLLAIDYLRLKKAIFIKKGLSGEIFVNIMPLIKADFIKVSPKKSKEDDLYVEELLKNVQQRSVAMVSELMEKAIKVNNELFVQLMQ